MKQRNKQKNFLPFKIASFSIFTFFLIYILFGLDGWGSRATNENAIGEIKSYIALRQSDQSHDINKIINSTVSEVKLSQRKTKTDLTQFRVIR